jgi:K+-transporting ATPase c subunit
MALTKETIVDKIEVLEMGQLQVRTATRVKEDGKVLSSSFHRHIIQPSDKESGSWADTDISGEDARVQAVANATWTDSVKTAYQAMIDAKTLP